jgi:hypothetical protein
MIRTTPTDELRPAFIYQACSYRWEVAERNSRASGGGSVQIERKRTELFRVHSSA